MTETMSACGPGRTFRNVGFSVAMDRCLAAAP